MELLREITEEYNADVLPLMEAITKSVKELKLTKKGGTVTNKMVKDYIKANPKLTAAAAAHALSAYKYYKSNQRNTIKLFAKSPYEKRLMTTVVKSMVDSKKFKLVKSRYAEGGKLWELKKIKSGY